MIKIFLTSGAIFTDNVFLRKAISNFKFGRIEIFFIFRKRRKETGGHYLFPFLFRIMVFKLKQSGQGGGFDLVKFPPTSQSKYLQYELTGERKGQ